MKTNCTNLPTLSFANHIHPVVPRYFGAITALTTLLSSSLHADVITPVNVTASSFYSAGVPDERAPIHTIDGSGLNGSGEHSSFPNSQMWLSNGEVTPTITWDLGSFYDLTSFHLWNYNENTIFGNLLSRGVQTADVQVSQTSSFAPGTYTDLGIYTFLPADGLNTYTGQDNIPLAASNVEFVRFNVQSNYGASGYTGLSEIRFTSTPEPSAFALLTTIGTLLIGLRQRKSTAKLP